MPARTRPNDAVALSASQRLDKWLWYARVAKTRTYAASLVQGGKVRVNRGRTTKPGQSIKIDDVITIAVHGRVRILRVLSPGQRRGPAMEAATLFEELTPDVPDRSISGPADPSGRETNRGARPTKRDRRALDRLRDSFEG